MRAQEYLSGLKTILDTLSPSELDAAAELLLETYRRDGTVFLCGNGGSAATASHLMCDLQKSVRGPNGRCLRAVALTDSISLITAWANDFDYARIFEEQVSALGRPGDLLVAISGSGRSTNVIRAVERANEIGLVTLGLTGFDGGILRQKAQHCIVVSSDNMQQIEDAHLMIGHLIFSRVRDEVAGNG
ncbi:MAG: D-sedoheptulose-7-phosphate isomerase [Armatimonadota bacterium]